MDQAFHLPFNLRTFEKTVKIDPRVRNGPAGFCAIKDERLVGFVGVWDLPTRNLDGDIAYIGGIYGVATLPSYMRKGICTALMSAAHEYFKQKGYLFSFLSAMPTSVAYNIYKTMGYKDLTEFPSAYKIIPSNHAKTYKEKTENSWILTRFSKSTMNIQRQRLVSQSAAKSI
jgi:GNAT superfamily N-acetyltransferase